MEEKRPLTEQHILTPEQFQRFLDEVETVPAKRSPIDGKVARLCFEFMEDTGCRITETLHVKKQDIDFKTRIVTVTHPKSEKECKCSRWKYKDQYSRVRVLDYADPNCRFCFGKGKWKKPQRTTITPRIIPKLYNYCKYLHDDDLLFPISRVSMWKFGKLAGINAKIDIFQQKDEKLIKGVFLHLFRALCSLRITKDAVNDPYQDQLVSCKLRHSPRIVTERYTRIDINYLLAWEARNYAESYFSRF